MAEQHFLFGALIFLVAAILVVSVVQRLKVSPVLGYLIAGAAIGPHGLGAVDRPESVAPVAELGVAFLLFTVGLELPLERLRVMRASVFGLGGLQVALTGVTFIGLGVLLGLPPEAASVVGLGLALSSTAVVLKLLSDAGEMTARHGRLSLAVLLFQDLMVAPLLVLVTVLGRQEPSMGTALGWALIKGAVALVALFVIGRLVLRPAFRLIAAVRNTELFAASTLAVVLATSWLTEHAGLSMALGAFLAGMLLAETEFRHQVAADIQPYRGILLGLFFMTVGMSVDLALAFDEALTIAGILAAVLAVKAAILTALARLVMGQSLAVALRVGLLLAQASEFTFVLLTLALGSGVVPVEDGQILTVVVAASMAITPALAAVGARLSARIAGQPLHVMRRAEQDARDGLSGHILIAGFGRVGQTVAKLLDARGVPYVAVDLEPQRVIEARGQGHNVYYGDASRPEVLDAVHAARARAAAVTLDSPEAAAQTVAILRHHCPDLPIFARARDHGHRAALEEAGATFVMPESVEASLHLAGTVLRATGADLDDVARLIEEFRADGYARLGDALPPDPAAPPAAKTGEKAGR